MMKKTMLLFSMMMLILVACGGNGGGETAVSPTSSSPHLNTDYKDALPVQSQLAVGTLQLENTDLAVDEAEAAEILPLWRALQSLDSSDTTAEAELTAVVNQIQNTMKPEQISAIADMKLTRESVTALIEDGTLTFGGRGNGVGGEATNSATGGFAPPGGLPPGALGGGPGGGPGGGMPGAGFGGGQGQANLSEDDLATRQAARESGDFGGFQARAMTGAVILLLETKTGEVTERVDPFADIWSILNDATGLTTEEIQSKTVAGKTLTELIEANGGDVAAVKADLMAALQDSPMTQRQDFDLDAYVTNMLTNSNSDSGPAPENPGNNN